MDVEIACLTIGAPGQLESVFHSTEAKSDDRAAAIAAAYAELPQEISDLKRQLKNVLKKEGSEGDMAKLLTMTSEEPLELTAASEEVHNFFTVQGETRYRSLAVSLACDRNP